MSQSAHALSNSFSPALFALKRNGPLSGCIYAARPSTVHHRGQQIKSVQILTISSSGYGIPDYGVPKTPSHNDSQTLKNPNEGSDLTAAPNKKFWEYGAPKNYQSPESYKSPKAFTSPAPYGPTTLDVENSGGGGGGGGEGGGEGGSGFTGGNGGNGSDDGRDGGDSVKKLKTSQLLTLIYAALVFLGGLAGFLKSGSKKSLTAGLVSAVLLLFVANLLATQPVTGSIVGLGVSGALLAVMGRRFLNSGKFFPAGFVSLLSLIMGGGYIHGIARSSHA